jgi:hypothetical protein
VFGLRFPPSKPDAEIAERARSTALADSDLRLKTWLNGKERGSSNSLHGSTEGTRPCRGLQRVCNLANAGAVPRRVYRAMPRRRKSPTASDSIPRQRE